MMPVHQISKKENTANYKIKKGKKMKGLQRSKRQCTYAAYNHRSLSIVCPPSGSSYFANDLKLDENGNFFS